LPAPARADLWITGYYPGYESGVMAPSNIDFSVITHVIHFALTPETNGTVNRSDNNLTASACAKLVGLAHGAGRMALVCVGGEGSSFLGATTSANLGTFVTNIVKFMSNNAYDGVDLDWEPLESTNAAPFTNLVNNLRAALDGFPSHKLLTMAAPAYPDDADSPTAVYAMLASVQTQFDQINIMTYDLSGPWGGWVTWHNSPIYDGGYTFPSDHTELVPSINGAISNYVNNGVLPGKLGIGLPFYGYIWTGGRGVTQPRQTWPSKYPPTMTDPSYEGVMDGYYQSNLYHWDNIAQAAYLSITNTPASNDMFISYDDTHSCQAKVSYARNLHLGGVMIWELSQDYFPTQPAGQNTPLTTALKQALATPAISAIQCDETSVNLNFSTLPLGLYRVEWSDYPALSPWNTLTDNVAGTGTNVQITDPTPPTLPSRFYRIQTPP
jgi:chitinase